MLRLGLGACVFGSALALGCSQSTRTCPTCGSSPVAAAPTRINTPTRVVTAGRTSTSGESKAPSPYHVVPQTPVAMTVSAPEVVVTTSAKPPADPPAPTPAAKIENSEWQVIATKTAHDESVRRRSFTDVTVKPCFAHAADYSWLVGELEADQGGWRLHFASVDDPSGGSVRLVISDTNDLKDGMIVRVEGQMAEPRSAAELSEYRVHSIRKADNP